MREILVGLRERLERKVREVGLDRDAGGGEWDGWCRVGVCTCVCEWVGGWVGVLFGWWVGESVSVCVCV